ncbi:MAG: sugar transferase [Anaerolineae bacterium]|nr:sugar transferase [Anaerolineae bacterium]
MLKRAFDVIFSAVGLVILAPLFLILALLVRITSPGPAFYHAQRVGKDGQAFTLIKFRTMVSGAAQQGPGITVANDRRVTPIGRWLRQTKLDELPQLINVLRGEMSFVGPRPEDPRYVALYTPAQRAVLNVRPGITSQASLQYRHEEHLLKTQDWEDVYVHQIMPAKLAIDLEYVQQATLWGDLKLIITTILDMVKSPPA